MHFSDNIHTVTFRVLRLSITDLNFLHKIKRQSSLTLTQLPESPYTGGRNKFYIWLACFIHRKHPTACEFKLSTAILETCHH